MIIGPGQQAAALKERAVSSPRQGELGLIGHLQMFSCVRQKNHHVINTPRRSNLFYRLALVIHKEAITPVARNDAIAHCIATIPCRTPSLPGSTLCHKGALSLRAFPHLYETPFTMDCQALRVRRFYTGRRQRQKWRHEGRPEHNSNQTILPSDNS